MRVKFYFVLLALLAMSVFTDTVSAMSTSSSSVKSSSELPLAMLGDTISSSLHFKISYRINRYGIDSTYMENSANLRSMRYYFSNPQDIDSIVIFSFASPEGPYENNMRLARNRGISAKNFIMDVFRQNNITVDDNFIRLRTRGENWKDLKAYVKRTYEGKDRDAFLEILESDIPDDQKKKLIKNLGPDTWNFTKDHILPALRSAEIVCIYTKEVHSEKLEIPKAEINQKFEFIPMPVIKMDSIIKPVETEMIKMKEKKFVFAVKSNLLYDALTWTNFGLEVPFKIKDSRFSIVAEHQFPWWRIGEGNNKYCMRYLQSGGEARWWFAPQKKARTRKNILRENLAGHYLGLYGMGGKYDFEWGRKICYQGEFWSAGISYGYSMPISRVFNLEFSVSLGYASIPYRHYIPSDDYEILYRDPDKMGRLDYFGITKLGVSLVMPINIKYKAKAGKGHR